MTSYPDFFVDFAVGGAVLGAGLGSEPGAWVDALGPRYVDNDQLDGVLIRYFGFIDVTFRNASGAWRCGAVDVKVVDLHRFPDMVPGPVAARYGEFPHRIPFGEVADRAVEAGLEIYHVRRRHPASLERYWIPDGAVMFSLVSAYQAADLPALHIGDLHSAGTAAGVDLPAESRTRYR
jgi:hypothetical protein